MELTIARILFSKEVQGRGGVQHNVRFTTNEMGEQSISGFFDHALKEGEKLTGEVVDKPGTNRDGQSVVYHNFTATRRAPAPVSGEMNIKLDKIYTEVYATRQETVMIRQLLQEKGVIPSPAPAKNTKTAFDDVPMKDESDDYDIAPEDIPFD